MNHYAPLEIQKNGKGTGLWHYCCSNPHSDPYPIGYCAGWSERTRAAFEKAFPGQGEDFFKDQERRRPLKDRYHTHGHKTAEEAMECYRQYEIDLRSTVNSSGKSHEPCIECGELTNRSLVVRGMKSYRVCVKHNDHEMLQKFHRASVSMSSY